MKAITLINPRGERLELTNVEFYELQLQFANSKTFEQWSEKRRISRAGLEKEMISGSVFLL